MCNGSATHLAAAGCLRGCVRERVGVGRVIGVYSYYSCPQTKRFFEEAQHWTCCALFKNTLQLQVEGGESIRENRRARERRKGNRSGDWQKKEKREVIWSPNYMGEGLPAEIWSIIITSTCEYQLICSFFQNSFQLVMFLPVQAMKLMMKLLQHKPAQWRDTGLCLDCSVLLICFCRCLAVWQMFWQTWNKLY